MANLTITNYDNAGVCIGNELYEDALLTFGAADDYAEGTILAKSKVAAGTAVAGTNTGNGTLTLFALASGAIAKVGNYVVTCIKVGATHGGTFSVVDPKGALVAEITMPDTVGGTYAFEGDGISFTLTDGTTNFALGDSFTLPVTAISGKYVVYSPTGTGGAEFPVSVLTYAASKAASGDLAARILVRGDVRKEKLVIDSGASVGAFEIEELKKNLIVAISVDELNGQDNQ